MCIRDSLHIARKATTIAVSHDLRRLLPICDRIIAIFEGEVVFDGLVDDIRASNNTYFQDFVSARFDL